MDTAQHVVAAQFENDQIGRRILRVERERQPLATRGTGIARYAGIDHARICAACTERILELFGVSLLLVQPVTGKEAVPEREDTALGPGDFLLGSGNRLLLRFRRHHRIFGTAPACSQRKTDYRYR